MSLSTAFQFLLNPQLTTSNLGTLAPRFEVNLTLADGTTADQANIEYIEKRNVVTGTPDLLDLYGGTLKQLDLTAAAFREVVILAVRNLSTTQVINVGGAASNPFSAFLDTAATKVPVKPGGLMLFMATVDPAFVVDNTHKILQVEAPATNADYLVGVAGRNA